MTPTCIANLSTESKSDSSSDCDHGDSIVRDCEDGEPVVPQADCEGVEIVECNVDFDEEDQENRMQLNELIHRV